MGYDTVEQSYVNIIETPVGGTHLAGFEAGLVKTLRADIRKHKRCAVKLTVNGAES